MTPPSEDVLDLLTAYALDALEPEEIARVSELLEQQPELRETLAELRATVQLLPYGLAEAEPAANLRQRTLDRATGRSSTTPRSEPARANPLRRWVLALGGLAGVAVLAAALAWSQLISTRGELARIQTELAAARTQQQQVAATLVQSQPVAVLSGSGGSGTVLRNSQGTTLVAARLPRLQPGRVYQFWLIQGNNAPVSGGTFTVDDQGVGLLTLGPTGLSPLSADTFAVTDEPAGGSPGPTTPILIAGQQAST